MLKMNRGKLSIIILIATAAALIFFGAAARAEHGLLVIDDFKVDGAVGVKLTGLDPAGGDAPPAGADYGVTITMPYEYMDETIDLIKDFRFTFDFTEYEFIKREFVDGKNEILIGSPGDTATLKITYSIVGEEPPEDAGAGGGSDIGDWAPAQYETKYMIETVCVDPNPAKFEGDVKKSVTLPNKSISFTEADFKNLYKKNDEAEITGVTIKGENKSTGKLTLDGAQYTLGQPIAVGDLPKLKFAAESAGNVTYEVYAHNAALTGSPKEIGKAAISITVSPEPKKTLNQLYFTINMNNELDMNDSEFNTEFRSLTGNTLYYVKLSQPSSSNGKLYYNYTSYNTYDYQVSSGDKFYYRESPRLSNVTFVPKDDYVGNVTFSYTAYDEDENSYEGSVRVTMENSGDSGSGANNSYLMTNTVTYYTDKDKAVFLSSDDFAASMTSATGYTLSYIRILTLPARGAGELLYDYSKTNSTASNKGQVTLDTRYYNTATPEISNMYFSPAGGYTGTVNIPYTAYTTVGTAFGGTLYIRVGQPASTYTLGDLNYSVKAGSTLKFSAADFQTNLSKTVNSTLSYIMFRELPSGGALYYNYRKENDFDSKASTSSRYYRATNPIISSVTFVPKAGQSGSVTIPYMAYTTSGQECAGKIVIKLESVGNLKALSYTAIDGEALSFRNLGADSDIRNLVRQAAGSGSSNALSYVVFDVPQSQVGALYKKYASSASQRQKIAEGEKYNDTGSPAISSLTFVPGPGNKIQLSYVAYTASGSSYNGKINFKLITPPDGWARDEVASLAARGIPPDALMSIYNRVITRAEYTALLVRTYDYSGSNAKRSEARASAFTDLLGNPYSRQITKGYGLGIIDGNSPTIFDPDSTLTREAAAKILCATVSLISGAQISSSGDVPYSDAGAISDWALPYVKFAYDNGLMIGDAQNRFNPQDSLTREEAMALVERMIVKYHM